MTYQLTDHQKGMIDRNVDVFAGDLRVGILRDYDPETFFKDSGSVFMYVDAWQGYLYFTSLGHFENPNEVQATIREYINSKNQPHFSAREMVLSAIAKVSRK